jgi:predicted RNA-binding Zn ribbon-like protein
VRPEPRVVRPTDILRAVVAFALAPDGGNDERRATWELDRVLMIPVPQMVMARLQDMPDAERAVLRAALRSSLLGYVTRGRKTWRAPLTAPLAVTEIEVWKRDDGRRELNFDGPAPAAFWFAVAVLVQDAGDHLSRCERCGRLFVRERLRRGDFCSRACGQRQRAADYYARHREQVLDRRHQRHERAIKQQYPKAKVARRRRPTGKGRQR